jgi:hypothetical protein
MTKVGDILVVHRVLKFYQVVSLRPTFTIRECKIDGEKFRDGSMNLKIVTGEFIGDVIEPVANSQEHMSITGVGELEHTSSPSDDRTYHYDARHVTSADYARKGELDPCEVKINAHSI